MLRGCTIALLLTISAWLPAAQTTPAAPPASPPEQALITSGGRTLSIKYSAPSVNKREGHIFGPGGLLSKDPTYPVWRAGANAATAFHTDANVTVGNLAVPKGDYTLYVDVADPNAWLLVINKQTGQWGLTYDQAQDLGRVKMDMSKPVAPIETLKYAFADIAGNHLRLSLSWEDHIGSVAIVLH